MKDKHNLELIQLYRELFSGRYIERRSTFLSDVDQLTAIQLAVVLLQKELNSRQVLSASQLIKLQKDIVSRKSRDIYQLINKEDEGVSVLTSSEYVEGFSFDEVYEAYSKFLASCNMIDRGDCEKFLKEFVDKEGEENEKVARCKDVLSKCLKKDYVKKETYSYMKTIEIQRRENINDTLSPIMQSPINPSVLQLRRVILAYLQLLVNSRDEIALARVIDVPSRNITHHAFTDIRMLGTLKSMPMFQIVSSFVRQLNLGGLGYAPDEQHTLFKHREGLKEFIELIDKVQAVIDEGDDIKVCILRVFKVLKTSLVRAKTPVYSTKIVNVTFSQLSKKIKYFYDVQKSASSERTEQLRDLLDYMSCIWGNDIDMNSTQLCGVLSTPQVNQEQFKRISTLATQFTTPDLTEETPRKPKGAHKRNFPNSPDVQRSQKTPLGVNLENCQMLSSPVCAPPVKIIRCHDARFVSDQTEGKQQVPKKLHKVLPKRLKASKKIHLLTGQKTLNQFFT